MLQAIAALTNTQQLQHSHACILDTSEQLCWQACKSGVFLTVPSDGRGKSTIWAGSAAPGQKLYAQCPLEQQQHVRLISQQLSHGRRVCRLVCHICHLNLSTGQAWSASFTSFPCLHSQSLRGRRSSSWRLYFVCSQITLCLLPG